MDAKSDQRRFWNDWNTGRETALGQVSLDQAEVIEGWLQGRNGLDILDVGSGSGWFCERLVSYGSVVGTDLANESIARARQRVPAVDFIVGDFIELEFDRRFDVITSLEVLSHVADQPAFVAKIAGLLKPSGVLMLATQNRFVLERSDIPPPGEGQLRQWIDRRTLRNILEPHFIIEEMITRTPLGHRGALRIVNSPKLNSFAGLLFGHSLLNRTKEFLGLGWTILVRAKLRNGIGSI